MSHLFISVYVFLSYYEFLPVSLTCIHLHMIIYFLFRTKEKQNIENNDLIRLEWQEESMIYMDDDPVYYFNLGKLCSYVLLMHVKLKIVKILRRILLLFLIWFWNFLLIILNFMYFGEFNTQYFLVVPYPAIMVTLSLGLVSERYESSISNICTSALVQTFLHLPFIFPIFIDPRDISETLSWNEAVTAVGRYMLQDGTVEKETSFRNSADRLYKLLMTRLSYPFRKRFWSFMFECFLIPLPEQYCKYFVLRNILYILKLPIVLVCVPFLTLPIFTVFPTFIASGGHCMCKCCCRCLEGKDSANLGAIEHYNNENTLGSFQPTKLPKATNENDMVERNNAQFKNSKNRCKYYMICLCFPLLFTGYIMSLIAAFCFLFLTTQMLVLVLCRCH